MGREEYVRQQRVQIKSGQIIYKYELKQTIGSGGFGDVWLAVDHTISRKIAVKILAEGVAIDERLQEARIGNHLNHANLVKMHYADVVQHNGTDLVIIAMDYHENGSILSRVNTGNFLPIPDVIRFMCDILRGLEYLHELNLYHNDIKPKNILVGASNQGVLTDYGITCHSPNGMPVQPRSAYKLHIAPEILNSNQINIQTDIYQVGLTAFRLLNGIGYIRDKFNTFGERTYNKLVKDGKLVLASDYQPFIPRNLKSVINKAIHIDPANRYKSALEMRRALERLSYPGCWTTDSCGSFIGHSRRYTYRFEEQALTAHTFEFIAFKKFEDSGRETKISVYSNKNVTRKQKEILKRKFMQWVVTG
jgi:serine/threonine protein kinase